MKVFYYLCKCINWFFESWMRTIFLIFLLLAFSGNLKINFSINSENADHKIDLQK